MKKNKVKVNTLIKRKGLVEELRSIGIKRISKKGERKLFDYFDNVFEMVLRSLKEEMEISGKRILDEEVVESFIENKKKEDFEY